MYILMGIIHVQFYSDQRFEKSMCHNQNMVNILPAVYIKELEILMMAFSTVATLSLKDAI